MAENLFFFLPLSRQANEHWADPAAKCHFWFVLVLVKNRIYKDQILAGVVQ